MKKINITPLIIFIIVSAFILFSLAGTQISALSSAFACSDEAHLSEELEILSSVIDVDANKNYELLRSDETAFGKILRFQQIYDNKPVEGAQITVSVDKNSKVLSSSGKYIDIPKSASFKLSPERASAVAFEKTALKVLTCEEIYFYNGNEVLPAYNLLLEDMSDLCIDASTGEIISCEPSRAVVVQNKDAFDKLVNIDVEFDGSKYLLHDEGRHIYIFDFKQKTIDRDNANFQPQMLDDLYTSATGTDFDSIAVSVMDTLEKAYDFYADSNNIGVARYGINGKNNNGDASDDFNLYVLLNYDKNYNGADYKALYSNKELIDYSYLCVGTGTRKEGALYQQGKAADVIAHEYQHGVTSFVAQLNYQEETGALDEAFSDIFGALVEGNDPSDLTSDFWKIGENGVYSTSDGACIRSLIGGTSGQAYNMRDKNIYYTCNQHRYGYHDASCDNGRVHANSTVISRVQYVLSSLAPEFFTRERIGVLWYTTLQKLTPTARFSDFTNQFINSAIELGYSEDIQNYVIMALSDVGLSEGYNTISFIDYSTDEVILKQLVQHNQYLVYDNIKDKIECDRETPSCLLKFNALLNEDGSFFDESQFDFVDSDIDVYVQYKKFYTVDFKDKNGDVLFSSMIEEGEGVKPPSFEDIATELDNKQYVCLGWQTEGIAEDKIVDFEKYKIYRNTAFTPLLTLKTYRVSFYFDDALLAYVDAAYGTNVDFPDVKRDGYSVSGWYFDKNLTQEATEVVVLGDTDIFVKWISDEKYDQKVTAIIIGASLAALFIIGIPIIIIVTKKRRKNA